MKCPYLSFEESKVVDSRHSEDGQSIRRRRECLSCQKRFTTYETVERVPMVVVKRDGTRQSFDRNKVINSMLRACDKRAVALSELESAADEIEQSIQNSLDREISSESIGELVIDTPAPAIADAIFNATGVMHHELPITSEMVWRGIHEKK